MPSDSKKKRDLQKKAAAKQRQAPSGKKNNPGNAASADNNPNDEDSIDDNDDGEDQNENENPTAQTNGSANKVDPNVKSLIQNLDLLTMVERANADARACTGKNEKIFFFSHATLFFSLAKVSSEVILAVVIFISINFPLPSMDKKS